MGLVIGIVIVFGIMAIAALHIHNKEAARRELMARPLPPAWARILRDVRLYHKVPRGLREQLHGFIQVFVAEKRFEGCGGQEITDEIRVT
ncbi:MAG TPA: zinc-dependent peptidase, partial [Sedimentisphaerales bacterium]|nr:zinc-dependent peptidase [Sedimentisphaerales bacterium]